MILTPHFCHVNRRRNKTTAEAGAAVELSVCTTAEASLPVVNGVPLGDNSVQLRRESLSSCFAAVGAAMRDGNEKAKVSAHVAPIAATVAPVPVAAAAVAAAESTAEERGTAKRKIAWRQEEEEV